MRIYGLDFTSAPGARGSRARKVKRLMLASGWLEAGVLQLESFETLNRAAGDFSGWEAWLRRPGPWVAGVDFPLGLPADFVDEVGWPGTWSGYVNHAQRLGKLGFEGAIRQFRQGQPPGLKHRFRVTDRVTGSQSPMCLAGTPVGKMFFVGAPRLCQAPVSILPQRPRREAVPVILETYPALVARKWLGRKAAYKTDDPRRETPIRRASREQILTAVSGHEPDRSGRDVQDWYGCRVLMTREQRRACLEDFTGDLLDSLLCALQAAWAATRRESGWGIPAAASRQEGWIVDPEFARWPGGD